MENGAQEGQWLLLERPEAGSAAGCIIFFIYICLVVFILVAVKYAMWFPWFQLQVSMISNNPYKCKESYSHWGVCYGSLISCSQTHMVGTSSKDTKIQKKWKLKSIQVPAFVHPSRKPKHYKTYYDNNRNCKKISTVFVPTNVKGRDKKQKATKQKKQVTNSSGMPLASHTAHTHLRAQVANFLRNCHWPAI